jgi:O-antigen/teichoic acid export membrane protein
VSAYRAPACATTRTAPRRPTPGRSLRVALQIANAAQYHGVRTGTIPQRLPIRDVKKRVMYLHVFAREPPHVSAGAMKLFANRVAFARVFGGAVVSQGLLSVINLLTGLILIRRAPQAQYGYYVLIVAASPLLTQIQNQLISPLLTTRVTTAGDEERKDYVGALVREQRHLLAIVAAAGVMGCGLVWFGGALRPQTAAILVAGVIAALAMQFREFFRLLLVSYRRPYDVLRADVVFAVLLVGGIWLSTLTSAPAALSALTLAGAAVVGGLLLSRALWRHDPWNPHGSSGAFATSVRLGVWSATGAVIHWVFTQGYSYIVAARLDVSAVAAIAATRLLLSPLGVFSLGISSVMFATSKLWLRHHGPGGLLRRNLVFTLGMACATIAYVIVMWSMRDWIFLHILKRDYPQRDLLLGIWSLIFFCTVIRDQVIFLLMAKGQFKRLAGLTLFCAALGISVTFVLIRRFGAAGGLLGLLAGEVAHVVGVMVLTFRDMRAGVRRPNDLGVPS